eukprot:CAMPEP_0203888508 /NCGR_PEP_ID=MMETSP0359-20131031/32110_1 /ASSEMBLY_ACC=CAM_ASM_000338 /TAXON_ID=268821 /ORGANISM="Scrippsiella Hangoei, Strain SHTV-5" /LENGTH=100 /DNA_ID=CAMNT_0050809713 /DNA_START=159 /DNA_END=461 /DNA_ORIENTATION=-
MTPLQSTICRGRDRTSSEATGTRPRARSAAVSTMQPKANTRPTCAMVESAMRRQPRRSTRPRAERATKNFRTWSDQRPAQGLAFLTAAMKALDMPFNLAV